jgi:hypothetical protein
MTTEQQLSRQLKAPVKVVDGWLFVDGCKVARVSGRRLAFKDRCQRRSSKRGSDQPSASLEEIATAIEADLTGNES